jgi:hypothetical protein
MGNTTGKTIGVGDLHTIDVEFVHCLKCGCNTRKSVVEQYSKCILCGGVEFTIPSPDALRRMHNDDTPRPSDEEWASKTCVVCGASAESRIINKYTGKDLFLCLEHTNERVIDGLVEELLK